MGKLLTSEKSSEVKRLTDEERMKKWADLGFFDNFKGTFKENIAKLYECCASTLINDSDTKKEDKEDQ